MIERYSREIALREQLRLFVSQHYPDDAHIYDHIWESLWQITGSNQIEDFVNISGWHFRPTAIEDGGMSGGACSPETVQAMLCAMHVTTNIYIDDADDVFSVPHIESRLQEAGAKLNLAKASIQILKDYLPSMIEELENVSSTNTHSLNPADHDHLLTANDSRWCTWLLRDTSFQQDGLLSEGDVSKLIDNNTLDIIIDEPRNRITIKRKQTPETDAVYALDEINSNEIGMLWLLLTKAKAGYITNEDFMLVRTSYTRLHSDTAYKNFRDKFREWVGTDLARRWHGHFSSGRISVNAGSIGYLWIRQHQEHRLSRLLAKSHSYNKPE